MTTYLHDGDITLENGIRGDTWHVETGNPATFHQAISDPGSVPGTTICAQTFLPSHAGRIPIVVVVPGSLGIAPSHVYKAELLTNAGFGACLLDPFGSRNVESTVANQAQYSFAASAWDVLATVAALTEQGVVDADRIGVQGHSRGGAAALSAASMAKFTHFRGTIAGVYAAYPWSGQQFVNPSVGTTRVRSIVGDQDEWCLPQQVQAHMHALSLCGNDATCRIVAGAHHSFDRGTPVELVQDASVAPSAPTIYIDDDGTSLHPVEGRMAPETSERDLMLYGIKAGYGRRGARLGTTGDQADVFHADMMDFWQGCLADV